MFSEEDLLPLSALQHLLFCERQCALIHVEQLWAENRLTVEGRHLHEKVDSGAIESRRNVRITRGVPLRSFRLGLSGKADVVEFVRSPASCLTLEEFVAAMVTDAARIGSLVASGDVVCNPVEYKRGKPKRDGSDEVQLCAQALCLEEMLGAAVLDGSLFYGTTRRRVDTTFDAELRARTEAAATRFHDLVRNGVTPRAVREPKCENCSLLHLCLPEALSPSRSASRYLQHSLNALEPSSSL